MGKALGQVAANKRVRLFKTYTPVYTWNEKSKKRFVVNQGSTSSSKTYSIDQVLAKRAIEESPKPGEDPVVISVVAKTYNALERGALRDFKKLVNKSELLRFCIKDPNLVRGPYKFKNGNMIEFISLQDPGNAKHGKRKYLFLNEANSINYEAAHQMMMRTTGQIFIDYNPDARFWVHDEIITKKDCDYFVSNFTHNPYCAEATKADLFSYRQKWLESIVRDHTGKVVEENSFWKNKWRVYGLGLTGIVEGVIFDTVNWINRMPTGLVKKGYGLDFGFSNDPTALCLCGMRRGEVYAKELIYEKGLTTPDLMRRFINLGINKKDLIVADSANPEAIAQMQRKGFNVVPCKKGPGSIISGINGLKEFPINITNSSTNWKTEQQNYKWKRRYDVWTNEPIDDFNHLWDPARYWYQHFHRPDKLRKKTRKSRKVKIIKQ